MMITRRTFALGPLWGALVPVGASAQTNWLLETQPATPRPGPRPDEVFFVSHLPERVPAGSTANWTHGDIAVERVAGVTRAREVTNIGRVAAATLSASRDHEITTRLDHGWLFLRYAAGRALRLSWKTGRGTQQTMIGIADNIDPTTPISDWNNGSFGQLWSADDLTSRGVPAEMGPDDTVTFGVRGFHVYLRYQPDGDAARSIELANFLEWRHVSPGRVVVAAEVGGGFGDMIVRHPMPVTLLSDPAASPPLFDLRDFGLAAIETRGAIAAGSNRLDLPSAQEAALFRVGDRVIVAVGGEIGPGPDGAPAAGRRGTLGVGGTWPAASFATERELRATAGQHNEFAWARDNGRALLWYVPPSGGPGAWTWVSDLYYSGAFALPQPLVASVRAVDGRTLTLDKAAEAEAADAAVYRDNLDAFAPMRATQARFPAAGPCNVRIPAGRFALSDAIRMQDRTGWVIEGAGAVQSVLVSPKGAPSRSLEIVNGRDCLVRNIGFEGNLGPDRFGMIHDTPNGRPRHPHQVRLQGCIGVRVEDCRFVDTQLSVSANYGHGSWARRCETRLNHPIERYIQWQYLWADQSGARDFAEGGGMEDCTIDSDWLVPGFESFRSSFVTMRRVGGRNVAFAINSSGPTLMEEFHTTIDQGAQWSAASFSPNNPIVNLNNNIDRSSGRGGLATRGAILRNFQIIQRGPINREGQVLQGIVINSGFSNVWIGAADDKTNRCFLEKPDWTSGQNQHAFASIRNQGVGTIVDGVRIMGLSANAVDPARGFVGAVHGEGGSMLVINSAFAGTATGVPGTITLDPSRPNARFMRSQDSTSPPVRRP